MADQVPQTCYDVCDYAYSVAESAASSSELCGKDSTFAQNIQYCDDCIQKYGYKKVASGFNHDAELRQYLDYCDTSLADPAVAIYTVTVTTAVTLGSGPTLVTFTETLTDPPFTAGYAQTTLGNQVIHDSLTVSNLNRGSGLAPQTNSTSTQVKSTQSPVTKTQTGKDPSETEQHNTPSPRSGAPNNLAWIAGPIMGGLAAMAFFILAFMWIKRRDRRGEKAQGEEDGGENGRWEKAELHQDPLTELASSYSSSSSDPRLKNPELHSEAVPGELEGSLVPSDPQAATE